MLQSWHRAACFRMVEHDKLGKGDCVMSFWSNLFGGKSKSAEDNPAVYGGDGLTDETPAIINCGSMRVAQELMNQLITSHCGKGWLKEIEFSLRDKIDPQKSIKMISVATSGGDKRSFYFDLSRPVRTSMKLQEMLNPKK